jgi:hypothetical protein
MPHRRSEPSVADALLADPLIQALMAADAVHPTELRALMLETARKIELGFHASASTRVTPAANQR